MNVKPQPIVNVKINRLFAVMVFAGSLLVYLLTQARTALFWDAGEYVTCSSILGIPHPPGNPFYILLGRFFVILFGKALPHAFVMNMLSGIFSAFAVMFTYLVTVKISTMWINKTEVKYAYLAGIIAAFYTAFSYTFWLNAIEAEVYAGLAFFINFSIWLTFVWLEKSDKLSHQHFLLFIIYLLFLGFGVHQTSLQIAPAVMFVVLYPMIAKFYQEAKSAFWFRFIVYFVVLIIGYSIGLGIARTISLPDAPKYIFLVLLMAIVIYHLRDSISTKAWLLALLVIVLGISTHLFLYIRSEFRPFINEGHPSTFEAFKNYVLRTQYGPTSMFNRRATFLYQMKDQFLTYFSWQFFQADTISNWLKAPLQLIQTLINLVVLLLGLKGIFYHFKKNKLSFYYFFAFFFMASIAMVFVINLSDKEVRDRDYFFVTAYNLWTVWLALGSVALIREAKKVKKGLSWMMLFLVLLFPAVNLASQYFVHDHSRNFIALDYGLNLLNGLEENAIIFTNGDNDTFPLWYAQAVKDPFAYENVYPATDVFPTDKTKQLIATAMEFKNSTLSGIRKDVSVANLSLLNTPWYLKQLRDLEGIEFNIEDDHIEQCQDNPSSALYPRQLPRDIVVTIRGIQPGDSFTVHYKAGTIFYVKDLAIIQIIRDNYGKRPIYFAVTVSDVVGFANQLKNEGMVDRLVSSVGESQVSIDRLVNNIENVYSYRSISDDSVYKDDNTLRLLNNYGAAYFRAAQYYQMEGSLNQATYFLENGIPFLEEKNRKTFFRQLSYLYLETGFNEIRDGRVEDGFSRMEKAIYLNPYDKDLPLDIYRAISFTEEYDRGIILLHKLKAINNVPIIEEIINEIQILKSELPQ
jgi:hypothetical protein